MNIMLYIMNILHIHYAIFTDNIYIYTYIYIYIYIEFVVVFQRQHAGNGRLEGRARSHPPPLIYSN